MKRRSFIKIVGGTAGSCVLGVDPVLAKADASAEAKTTGQGSLPRRVLGRTGEKISIIGFPGLSLMHYKQDECDRGVKKVFDMGLNYFDVAPAYNNGDCEIKLGVALQQLPRDQYFLSCKTKMRDKDGARQELERSLQRLKTDHFDLYQMHHMVSADQVKQAFGKDGAMETFLKAREAGKIRFIGLSAHTTRAALAALKAFNFDTIMFPLNFGEYYRHGFGKEVLELAKEKGTAAIAIKPMSYGAWPAGVKRTREWWYRSPETVEEIGAVLRFTLSLEGVVAGIPPSFLDLTEKAIQAAYDYRPITEPEKEKLKERAASFLSIFRREEEQLALDDRHHPYPHHPCDAYPCLHA